MACNSQLQTFLRYGQCWVPDCPDKSDAHQLQKTLNVKKTSFTLKFKVNSG